MRKAGCIIVRLANNFYHWFVETAPLRGIAFLLGLGLSLWGAWTLNPYHATFETEEYYTVLQQVAHENVFGVIYLMTGAIVIYGVTLRNEKWTRVGLFIGFLCWMLLAVLYALQNFALTPMVPQLTLAFIHGWVYIQSTLHPEFTHDGEKSPDRWKIKNHA